MRHKTKVILSILIGIIVAAILSVAAFNPKYANTVLTITTVMSVVISGLSLWIAIDTWKSASGAMTRTVDAKNRVQESIKNIDLSKTLSYKVPNINPEISAAASQTVIETISPMLDEVSSPAILWLSDRNLYSVGTNKSYQKNWNSKKVKTEK